ncbi:hypothetical protein H9L10_02715 [Phycicoccus endophyticus]|uniref:Glycosyltransferase family 39 protein n=1 Tax=Phycicoccus endophyticus TaxID=1690220 RepID=A0A7G9R334_9MICO|nr:hypothetical protein [Phycicoccus endophyticus]QNN50009.1 hypothetical protein H9L10_02715 [Phycicoccus endophyticus]
MGGGDDAARGLFAAVGWWTPWVGWPVAAVVAAGAFALVRPLPGVSMGARPATALAVVVLAFAGYAGATHSEHVLPRRDAASNLQAAVSLAGTHERVVSVDVSAFAGAGPLERGEVTLASAAFYQVGPAQAPAVQPQFLLAPAVVYGYGVWAGGARVAQLLPALAMGLVLLVLGLLTALVVGPWWGVAAAGLTGTLLPVLTVARGTYSEQLALLPLGAGLLALTLALTREGGSGRRLALLGGLLVGGAGLARVDALREVLLLLPLLALGAGLRRPWVRPAAVGLGVSSVLAYALAGALSYRYLADIAASLVPLAGLAAAVLVASVAGAWLWRRGHRLPAGVARRLPAVLAAGAVVVGLALWSRPWWLTVRADPTRPSGRYLAGMQQRQGLPVDGGRTYAEHSLDWLSWYLGWVALAVALLALAWLLQRAGRRLTGGRLAPWVPVLVVGAGSTLLTLVRPGITPDHPWADRRLLIALALVVVLTVSAAAWATRRLAENRWGPPVVVVLTLLAVAVPAVQATWPFRGAGVERGSLDAVATVCAALEPRDVVLMVDGRSASEWPQTVRGMCERPAVSATSAVRAAPTRLAEVVDELARGAAAEGHRLVVLAADGPEAIEGLGLTPRRVLDVRFAEEEHALDRPPRRTDVGSARVWLAAVGGS